MSIAAGSIAEIIYANVSCLLDSVCTCTVLCPKIMPLLNPANGGAGIIQDTVFVLCFIRTWSCKKPQQHLLGPAQPQIYCK
jgi:hypothetical protein